MICVPARSLSTNIAWQYLLQIATYVFPFITLPYLTRVLGPDGYAVRAYAVSVMGLVTTVVDYGFNQWGTREVALHRHDAAYIGRISSMICLLRFAMMGGGAAAVAAATPFIPLMAANPAYMMVAYVGACLSAMLPDFVFQGLEDMSILTVRYVGSKLVSVVLVFLLVHGPEDLVLVAVSEMATSLVAFAWSWADVVFARGIRLSLCGVRFRDLAACFKASTVFFFNSASTTIFTGLTTVMIGVFVTDAAQVSYWSLSMSAVAAVQSLYNPLANSLYPHVVAHRDLAPVKRLLMIGLPIVSIGTFLFWQLANVVMLVLGGPGYVAGTEVVRRVAPVLLFSFPVIMLGFPVLAAVGRERWLTASSVISAAFHVTGLFILAAAGDFTIPAVAVLRSCTEFVLMAARILFVLRWRCSRADADSNRTKCGIRD